ncbi:potential mitochondrial Complex I, 17.2 kd subunit [Pseudozyma hubeiensis SY62]|uniref:NADH dehydrogenase [ubiquinone] 1 alpha subcomplex subunit n=1 Tax=Pseudozyma hubeiensis (strain SY62) TaxID=1305764 RepID=R9P9R5_PSEHS|nr:potential mitochondrial Complex I, 17.2 kd subunit [Pseudozyma hubeiensis SY62]GAC98094.1 potential mitochondrial Complex I, 17.2 kd subunit [Pseudozyma hubeiensis SY62]
MSTEKPGRTKMLERPRGKGLSLTVRRKPMRNYALTCPIWTAMMLDREMGSSEASRPIAILAFPSPERHSPLCSPHQHTPSPSLLPNHCRASSPPILFSHVARTYNQLHPQGRNQKVLARSQLHRRRQIRSSRRNRQVSLLLPALRFALLSEIKTLTYSDAIASLECCRNGNKFYENHNEFNLRHRWVDYAADNEFNASQVDPLWHSWLHHIRKDPPHEDAGIIKMTQSWMTVSAAPR